MTESIALAEYLAQGRASGGTCIVCTLDPEIVKQVEAAVINGSRQWRAICRWVEMEHGVAFSPARLQGHFERGHHER